jgi:hypothetical protein
MLTSNNGELEECQSWGRSATTLDHATTAGGRQSELRRAMCSSIVLLRVAMCILMIISIVSLLFLLANIPASDSSSSSSEHDSTVVTEGQNMQAKCQE